MARYGEDNPAATPPADQKPASRGLFGFGASQRVARPVTPNVSTQGWQPPGRENPQAAPADTGKLPLSTDMEDPNNPRVSTDAKYRIEEVITANEQPGPRAAMTVSAAGAPGATGQVGRKVNFPRDPKDDLDILKLQIFLDYHGYSPGEIDGQWGYNTGRALIVYQQNNSLEATGQLDDRIVERLNMFDKGYLIDYTLTSDDLKGPYYTVPRDYYAMGKLKWLPYETPLEGIAEKFHCSQTLLRKLNAGMDLDNMQPGQHILGPNVIRGIDEQRGKVAVVRVSKHNKWAEAFDAQGNFMFYYPTTLGSKYDPLPLGTYEVTLVNPFPEFRYQPKLFWDVPDNNPETLLPPGPNSPVGKVWIGTSRKSVGIHGTPNPESISRNTSHGCIRMTNWDAEQLSKRVGPGTKLEFVD